MRTENRSLAAVKSDKANLPAIFGTISGVTVNEVFRSKHGPTILRADHDCTRMFAGTEMFLRGRPVATVGDGRTVISVDGNQLRLAVCLSARERGVAEIIAVIGYGGVTLRANAIGKPDRFEYRDGLRTAIIDDWMLSRIEFDDVEAGERGTCSVK